MNEYEDSLSHQPMCRRGNWLSQFKLLYVTLSLVDLLPLFTEKRRRRRKKNSIRPFLFPTLTRLSCLTLSLSISPSFFILCFFAFWALKIYFIGSNYHLNKYLYIIFKWILNGQHVSKLLSFFPHHYYIPLFYSHIRTLYVMCTMMAMCGLGLWVLFVWYFHQFISIKEWNLFYFSIRIYVNLLACHWNSKESRRTRRASG